MRAEFCEGAVRNEARLLFTLLDAADSIHLLREAPLQERWLRIKTEITGHGLYQDHAIEMFELLHDLDETGLLSSTWIGARFSTVLSRVDAANALGSH